MHPAKIQKRANAPFAALYRAAGLAGLPGTRRQSRQADPRRVAAGFARRLRALLASMDFRQLAGPMAVFFLWPPRPRHGPATAAEDNRRDRGTEDRHRHVR
jgi:hypothetical protein